LSKVFVSHSHEDKSIARRIARFLRRYGVEAWLDERELRLGNRLDEAIRSAIRESEVVVVVASHAAARSQWVAREVAFATDSSPALSVCPVYVDDVVAHPSFAPHLGIDARDRHQFSEVLVRLAEALVGRPLPQPDAQQLEVILDELSRQNSIVALLVDSCLRGEGLRYEHVLLVSEVSFHDLDDALDLISCLTSRSAAAYATAGLFARSGTGSAALARYIVGAHEVSGMAVGVTLDSTLLDAAIRLLLVPNPPDDQALASFLWKNAEALTGKYRSDVVRLVTHPDRGPALFGADAAAAAFRLFPEDDDLLMLWSRWVREGFFDEQTKQGAAQPEAFAYWCSDGLRADSGGWGRVFDLFVSHVRHLARTRSKQVVRSALEHMKAAADQKNPRLSEIVNACEAAVGSHEWNGWEDSDEMSIYVRELVAEARGECSWGKARLRARESWKAEIALRRAISELDDSEANR